MLKEDKVKKHIALERMITLSDYLDQELGDFDGQVSDELLRRKKQEYRQLYMKWYREHYYKKMAQVTLQFPKKELDHLRNQAKSLQMKLSVYIKSKLEDRDNHRFFTLKTTIDPIILELIDVIEECIHENSITGLSEALTILGNLENRLYTGKFPNKS